MYRLWAQDREKWHTLNREIARRYLAGEEPFDIAIDLDIGESATRKAISRAGIPFRGLPSKPMKPPDHPLVMRALKLYKEARDMTVQEIANEVGYSRRVVERWVARAGLSYTRQPPPNSNKSPKAIRHNARRRERARLAREARAAALREAAP